MGFGLSLSCSLTRWRMTAMERPESFTLREMFSPTALKLGLALLSHQEASRGDEAWGV